MLEYSVTHKEITQIETPDPEDLPETFSHYLLLREVPITGNKTKGGIIITDKTMDDARFLNNCFRVLRLGPTSFTNADGVKMEPWCKVGEYIVIPKNVGRKFNYKGVILTLINDDQPLMRVKSPADIDPIKTVLGGA